VCRQIERKAGNDTGAFLECAVLEVGQRGAPLERRHVFALGAYCYPWGWAGLS